FRVDVSRPPRPPPFPYTTLFRSADLPPPSAPCGAEGNLATDGSDGGAVWLICPVIPDPRDGAIARDAFLDTVRKPNGAPLDPQLDRKSTRLNSSHGSISYAVFCL